VKGLALTASVLALLAASYVLYARHVVDPRVIEVLRSDPHGERAARVMLLTLPDGRVLPVNYLREGDTVFVGADGTWWRSFRDGGAVITLEIRGETLAGHAVVVLNDPEYTRAVFASLRPRVPKWLPGWLDAKLVVVTISDNAGA
jgi:hypothetical protein